MGSIGQFMTQPSTRSAWIRAIALNRLPQEDQCVTGPLNWRSRRH